MNTVIYLQSLVRKKLAIIYYNKLKSTVYHINNLINNYSENLDELNQYIELLIELHGSNILFQRLKII